MGARVVTSEEDVVTSVGGARRGAQAQAQAQTQGNIVPTPLPWTRVEESIAAVLPNLTCQGLSNIVWAVAKMGAMWEDLGPSTQHALQVKPDLGTRPRNRTSSEG